MRVQIGTEKLLTQNINMLLDCDWKDITVSMTNLLYCFLTKTAGILNALFLVVQACTLNYLRLAWKEDIEICILYALHIYLCSRT